MSLVLSPEQKMLQEQASRYLDQIYGFEQRRRFQSTGGHQPEIWRAFAEFGWLGMPFSEEAGGFGFGPLEIMVLCEELGRHLVLEPFVETIVEAGCVLEDAGPEYAQRDLIAAMMSGSRIVTIAHGEPAARFDPNYVATSAERKNGKIAVSGRKSLVRYVRHAAFVLLSVREAGAVSEADGISLFLVDANAKGLHLRDSHLLDGSPAADLVIDGLELGAHERIGPRGGAATLLETASQRATAALAATATGSIRALIEVTAEHLRTRRQFGRPLTEFQALQHKLADMVIMLERARSVTCMAAHALASADPGFRRRRIAAAKAEIGRAGRFAGQTAVQLHGGIGTTDELAIGHHFKALEAIGLRFGDRDHHLARIADWTRAETNRIAELPESNNNQWEDYQ